MKAPGQVIDLPTPREEKRPDDAKFVSEHDSSVEHETSKYGRFEDNARQGEANGTASASRPAAPSGDGRMAMRTPDLGQVPARSRDPDRRRAQGGREARMACRTRATSNRAG